MMIIQQSVNNDKHYVQKQLYIKKNIIGCFFCMIAFITIFFSSAHGQKIPSRYALIIGITKYNDADIENVKGARNDAVHMARLLLKQKYKVILLTDKKATHTAIQSYLKKLKTQLSEGDYLLVYYAGFAKTKWSFFRSRPFLFPYNENPLTYTPIELSSILEPSPKGIHELYLIDACLSGEPLGTFSKIKKQHQYARQIIIAGTKHQPNTILDDQRHRLLSGKLLKALNGKADFNGDGTITFYEIWSFISPDSIDEIQTPRAHSLPGHQNAEYVFISPKGQVNNLPQSNHNSWKEPLTGMTFVKVPSGCFSMGCTQQCDTDSTPLHTVCIDSFWISQHEVTQKQWHKVMENQPSVFSGNDSYPVENVSWKDAQAFMKVLNEKTGGTYRLPTEAEWEFACSGTQQKVSYSGANKADDVSWTLSNSSGHPHGTGLKDKNYFNLFDMSGNVYEWCLDTYEENAYEKHSKNNPLIKPSDTNPYRVIRGGCWDSDATYSKCTNRNNQARHKRNRYTGFRVVRPEKP